MDLDEALAAARGLGRPSREVQIEVFDVLASAVERVQALCATRQEVEDGRLVNTEQMWASEVLAALDGEA